MCFVWIWEKRAIFSLYSINWLVCITEAESGSLNQTATVSSLKGNFQITWIMGTWAIISETQSSRDQRTYADSDISAVTEASAVSVWTGKRAGKPVCIVVQKYTWVWPDSRDPSWTPVSVPFRVNPLLSTACWNCQRANSNVMETRLNHFNAYWLRDHHQFNIQQLYALPTLYLCVLYLSENKQRLVPLTT